MRTAKRQADMARLLPGAVMARRHLVKITAPLLLDMAKRRREVMEQLRVVSNVMVTAPPLGAVLGFLLGLAGDLLI